MDLFFGPRLQAPPPQNPNPSPTRRRPRAPRAAGSASGAASGVGSASGAAISPELQTIVGETVMSRTQIVKQLWAYIRQNNLQDPDDKRKIICNDELRVVFGTDTTDMFKMNKLLAKHITPLDPKDQIREVKKLKAPNVAPQPRPPINRPSVVISDALAKFIGIEGTVPPDDALKYLWDYIKANQLECQCASDPPVATSPPRRPLHRPPPAPPGALRPRPPHRPPPALPEATSPPRRPPHPRQCASAVRSTPWRPRLPAGHFTGLRRLRRLRLRPPRLPAGLVLRSPKICDVQTVDSQPLDQEVEDEESDDDLDADLERFLHGSSTVGQGTKTELEVYMEHPLVEWKTKGKILFDVLSWWKLKQPELPILSRLARDVLSIQVSTVASESAFSAGGRVVDPFRSRLDPEVVQALVCTKDWTAASRKGGDIGGSILTEIDMEGIERCFASLATLQEHEDMDDLEEDVLEDMDE